MNQYFVEKERHEPKRVFLGGTCNGSTWRDKFIPLLNIDYFNPVVPTWDESAKQEELFQRRTCSALLYVITPKMVGSYAIAELVEDAIRNPHKTILILIRTDSGDKFSDIQWNSLLEVEKLVLRASGRSFTSLPGAAHYINNI